MSNEIFNLGLSTDAICVYVYMASKPSDWVYHRDEMQASLGMGWRKWGKATLELRKQGLYEVKKVKEGSVIRLHRLCIPGTTPERCCAEGHTNQPQHQNGVLATTPEWCSGQNTETVSLSNTKRLSNTKKDLKEKYKKESFKKPTIDEIRAYCESKSKNVNPEGFFSFYESKGWMVGKNKMKSWQAAVNGWDSRTTPGNNETNSQKDGRKAVNSPMAKVHSRYMELVNESNNHDEIEINPRA